MEELVKITNAPLKSKSLNQLKGGSGPNHPFYNSYTSFKLHEVCAYTKEDLQSENLLADSPINLLDDELVRRNKNCLPHMRFLLSDKETLMTAFMILICGP